MLRLITFISLFFLSSSLTWSNETKLAIIRKIQGGEKISPIIMKQLEKISLQVVARQPQLQLLLSPNDMPENTVLDIIAIESDITKGPTGYVIHTKLINVRTKKLINTAHLKNIRDDDILRLFESALQSLFEPWIKSLKKKESLEPIKSPSSTNSEKKKNKRRVTNQQQDAASIDFKQRVKDLKMGVDDKIDELHQEKKVETTNKINESSSDTNQISQLKESEQHPNLKMKAASKEIEYESGHKLNMTYDYRTIESLSLISTTTTSTLLNLNASGTQPLGLFSGKIGASYEASFAKPLSVPAEISSPYKIGFFGTYLGMNRDVSIGYVRESLFFINLPAPGEGLESENVVVNWLELKWEQMIDYKGTWDLLFSYAPSISTQTTYSPLKDNQNLKGQKWKLAASPPFRYAKWGTEASYEKINLNSQGDFSFTLNETRFALSARRSF